MSARGRQPAETGRLWQSRSDPWQPHNGQPGHRLRNRRSWAFSRWARSWAARASSRSRCSCSRCWRSWSRLSARMMASRTSV